MENGRLSKFPFLEISPFFAVVQGGDIVIPTSQDKMETEDQQEKDKMWMDKYGLGMDQLAGRYREAWISWPVGTERHGSAGW